MLRRHHQLLPFSSLSRTATAFSVLPVVCQNVLFASSKNVKIRFDLLDDKKQLEVGKNKFRTLFASSISSEKRCRNAWNYAKRLNRPVCRSNDPCFILKCLSTFAGLPYSASTKLDDLSRICLLYPSDFFSVGPRQLRSISDDIGKQIVEELPLRTEVKALSVKEMKRLTGEGPLPATRDIFKCWILGCGPSDLVRQKATFLPRHNIVVVYQPRRHDGQPFVRFVPCNAQQFKRVWQNGESAKRSRIAIDIGMNRRMKAILRKSSYTPLSVAEGAIEFLASQKVPEDAQVDITGRRAVHRHLRPNCNLSPSSTVAKRQRKNITKLIKAIFPDGKY